MYSQKFHDIAKHVAKTGHFVLAPPFFVSDKFMNKLDDKQKEAMHMASKTITNKIVNKDANMEMFTIIQMI